MTLGKVLKIKLNDDDDDDDDDDDSLSYAGSSTLHHQLHFGMDFITLIKFGLKKKFQLFNHLCNTLPVNLC